MGTRALENREDRVSPQQTIEIPITLCCQEAHLPRFSLGVRRSVAKKLRTNTGMGQAVPEQSKVDAMSWGSESAMGQQQTSAPSMGCVS